LMVAMALSQGADQQTLADFDHVAIM
jgi:hypothetical protein